MKHFKTTVQGISRPKRHKELHKEVSHHNRGIDSGSSDNDGELGEYNLVEKNKDISVVQKGLGNYRKYWR